MAKPRRPDQTALFYNRNGGITDGMVIFHAKEQRFVSEKRKTLPVPATILLFLCIVFSLRLVGLARNFQMNIWLILEVFALSLAVLRETEIIQRIHEACCFSNA
jgi:hypothetical protein